MPAPKKPAQASTGKPAQKKVEPASPPAKPGKTRGSVLYVKLELPTESVAVQRLVAEAKRWKIPFATHVKSVLLRAYDPEATQQIPQYQQQMMMPSPQRGSGVADDDIMASADALLDMM